MKAQKKVDPDVYPFAYKLRTGQIKAPADLRTLQSNKAPNETRGIAEDMEQLEKLLAEEELRLSIARAKK